MKQSPCWEAYSCSDAQEVPLLGKPMFRYSVYKNRSTLFFNKLEIYCSPDACLAGRYLLQVTGCFIISARTYQSARRCIPENIHIFLQFDTQITQYEPWALNLWEQHRWTVCDNRVLMGIF